MVSQENVFASFSALAVEHGSVNLGQGFPSFSPPDFLLEAAADAVMVASNNQYTRPGGHPRLVETLANFYSPRLNRTINPMTDICTAHGAQEATYLFLSAHCEPGDEVVFVEPYFDAYGKAASLSGLTTRGVPLRRRKQSSSQPSSLASANEYEIDLEELASTITNKTRVLIVNTPHNPTGKVFSRNELEGIAEVVRRFPNLLVLSDEVYEMAVFDGNKHERFATLDGMWERTVSVFSAGKTFSCTGWRVGYMIGPPHLAQPLIKAQSIVSFAGASPLEVATSVAFEKAMENDYFEQYSRKLEAKRDLLVDGLQAAGLAPIVPQGGYFTMADSEEFLGRGLLVTGGGTDGGDGGAPLPRLDYQAALALNERARVTCIPTSGFYLPERASLGAHSLRFAHCKKDVEISEGMARLLEFSSSLGLSK